MQFLDVELYRTTLRLSRQPLVRLSAIDIAPDHPDHTLVFIHGFAGNATQWRNQLTHFSSLNRVVAIDLRGHGRSEAPENGQHSMDDLIGDLETAFRQLRLPQRFVLIGHSFGGAVVTEYATRHPDQVEKLVLIASASAYPIKPIFRFGLSLPESLLRFISPLTRRWLGAPPTVLRRIWYNAMQQWRGDELFARLTVPTLVIRGHRDDVFDTEKFMEVSRLVPNAQDIDVGASGHLVMLERREAVNRAIEAFLSDRPRSWRESFASSPSGGTGPLFKDRPWLAHYDDGVPPTIAIPRMSVSQFLSSATHRFPQRIAIRFAGASLTYRRLNNDVNRFANALRSLGLQPGDRVMLLLPNLPQTIVAYFGVLKAGGVVVSTHVNTDADEVIREIGISQTRVLVTLTRFQALAERAKDETSLGQVVFTSVKDYLTEWKWLAYTFREEAKQGDRLTKVPLPPYFLMRQLLFAHSDKSPDVPFDPDALAVIQFTGGTTGLPKGVMLSHRNLVANTLQNRHWMADVAEDNERFLALLPFSHSYGLTTALNVPISMGATIIVVPRFDIQQVLDIIKAERPTMFPGVPAMYVAINNAPGVRRYGIESIKACLSGSAPLPVEVQEAFEKLTKGRLVEGYGLTEAGPVTHGNPLKGRRKVGSIGVPVPSTDARILDLATREPVLPGQLGELAIYGPQVMMGYWNDHIATRQSITPDGWLLTGDIAAMDDEGYFRIIARKQDLWYPGKPGEVAFPRDVEEVLFEIPQVEEACVVAIADQPIAFIIARRNRPTSESLRAYCDRRLPPELVPRVFIFVEHFPRNFIGKILRRELITLFQEIRAHGQPAD